MNAQFEGLPMYQISVDGEEIEIDGSVWRIAEQGRLYMGTYLKLDLQVSGTSTHNVVLRIKRESILGRTDNRWLLEAIRAFLQNPCGVVDNVELWL